MNENRDPKLLFGAIVVVLLIIFGTKIVIDKVTDRVIEKLQRDYGPSPYGPHFDPDKIDIDKLKKLDI